MDYMQKQIQEIQLENKVSTMASTDISGLVPE